MLQPASTIAVTAGAATGKSTEGPHLLHHDAASGRLLTAEVLNELNALRRAERRAAGHRTTLARTRPDLASRDYVFTDAQLVDQAIANVAARRRAGEGAPAAPAPHPPARPRLTPRGHAWRDAYLAPGQAPERRP